MSVSTPVQAANSSLLDALGLPADSPLEESQAIDLTVGSEAALKTLFAYATQHHQLAFDLGEIDVGCSEIMVFLKTLAKSRCENLYSFSLSAAISTEVSRAQVKMLKLAGLRRARIFDEASESALNGHPPDLKRLRAIRRLHEAEIEVAWSLAFRGATVKHSDGEEFEREISKLHHLPPPDSIRFDAPTTTRSASLVEDALQVWRRQFSPRSLTYARGPNFIRIFDRRPEQSRKKFITLSSIQCSIFDALEDGMSAEGMADDRFDVPKETISAMLEALAAARLTYRSGGSVLGLAVRRRLEESWTYNVQGG